MSRRSLAAWAGVVTAMALLAFVVAPVGGIGLGGPATGNPHLATGSTGDCTVPAQYSTITAALAAGCRHIGVGPGTYREQLTITRPVTLVGSGSRTILQPSAVSTNAPSVGPYGEDAAIAVLGTAGVIISNLAVDGSVAAADGAIAGQSSCGGPAFTGILFAGGASGRIAGTDVENFHPTTPSSQGCTHPIAGLGIDVASPGDHGSMVVITSNEVRNYQNAGITCHGRRANCDIVHNHVIGPSGGTNPAVPGPFGIVVADQASSEVEYNVVTHNRCGTNSVEKAICGSDFADPSGTNLHFDAAGVLLSFAQPGTVVRGNQLIGNDIGIKLDGSHVRGGVVLADDLIQSNLYAGVAIENGSFQIEDTHISGDSSYSVVVVALTIAGDSNSSAFLRHVNLGGLPTLAYATPPLTATIR